MKPGSEKGSVVETQHTLVKHNVPASQLPLRKRYLILDSEEKQQSKIVKNTEKKEASCAVSPCRLVPGVIRHTSEPFHSNTYLQY